MLDKWISTADLFGCRIFSIQLGEVFIIITQKSRNSTPLCFFVINPVTIYSAGKLCIPGLINLTLSFTKKYVTFVCQYILPLDDFLPTVILIAL